MWRISDEDIYLRLAKKKYFYVFLFCIDIIRNMSQTSERAEQIWCGWNKFGVGGANLEWMWAEQCGE